MKIESPQFITTATKLEEYPTLKTPQGLLMNEVAFVGRSNVGKSSLINHLLQSKGLARISSTPGKTQFINFFTVNPKLCFVDLPGYGFAKVPKSVRAEWGTIVQTYLKKRSQLKLILLLLDIRRTPSEEDLLMLEWAQHHRIPLLLVLTKVDKVGNTERPTQTDLICTALHNMPYVHYSVVKNIGRKELIQKLDAVLWETG